MVTPTSECSDILAVGTGEALQERMVRVVDRGAARLRRLVPPRLTYLVRAHGGLHHSAD